MSPGPAKQFDRQEVLARALDLFWRQGYEATGMAELLDTMKIGRQSLYDTFGDKRALFLEALRAYAERMSGRMISGLEAPGSPIENVKAVFAMMEKIAEEHGCKGCLIANSSAEFGGQDDEVVQLVRDCHDRVEDAFYRTFEKAKKAGELKSGTNTRNLARTVMSTMQGLALFSRLDKGTPYLRSVIRTVLDLLPVT